jgi:hypothetical protein
VNCLILLILVSIRSIHGAVTTGEERRLVSRKTGRQIASVDVGEKNDEPAAHFADKHLDTVGIDGE